MPNPTATIYPPYHAVDDLIQRGPRAAQPAASAVTPGTLYCVTDDLQEVDRSNGTIWEVFVRRPTAIMFSFDFSDQVIEPPTSSQVRINAAAPYTAATKIWIRLFTNDGRDLYWGLIDTDIGTPILIQDKNDHTIYASFTTTALPVDKTTYVEWPVAPVAHGGAALFNNQAVLVVKR